MTISVRLDRATEALLGRISRERGRSKSEVIRESIRALSRRSRIGQEAAPSAWERLRPYAGVVSSDGTLLAAERQQRWKHQLRRKHFDRDAG